MKKKSLKDRLLSLSIISSILIGIASSFVVTYAAIINKFVAQNNLQYDVSGYSAYFAYGSGSDTNPFRISSSDHLRNLQKLNSLGVFNENTYFQLSADITYEGDALLPIGTDDMPFNSKFDGMGHTITNLVVNGANTRDVGMFGYVGINGKVSNMILNHPTINLTANTAGDYNATANGALSTTNYLDSVLNSANNPAAKGLSNPTYSSTNETLTFTSTSITDSNGIIYTINYSSSSSLISNTAESNNIFKVSSTGDASLFTNDQTLVHITASVQSIINNNVINYTLERFAVTLKRDSSNGKVSIYQKDNQPLIEKTMWFEGTDTSGNSYTDYHETYIGFFIGHCDGGASYLGLYGGTSSDNTVNATLNISGRVVKSYGVLVGKSRTDNPRDITSATNFHKDFDFSKIKNLSDTITYSNSVPDTKNDFAINSIQTNNLVSNTKAQIDNIQKEADELTNTIVSNIDSTQNSNISRFIKFFPPASITKNTDNDYSGYKYSITGPLKAGSYQTYNNYDYILATYPSVSNSNYFAENGIFIWCTSELSTIDGLSSILGELFKEGGIFYITFNISYIPRNLATGNYFKILYNGFCDNRYYNITSSRKVNLPKTRYARWKDIGKGISDLTPYTETPVLYNESTKSEDKTLNDTLIQQTISIEIDTTSLQKWGLETGFSLSQQTNQYSPALFLGIANGDDPTTLGQTENYTTTSSDNTTTTTSINSWSKKILGITQYTFETGCLMNGTSVDQTNSSGKTFFFKDSYKINTNDNNKPAGIDIVDLDVTFTSSDGNSGSLLNKVDFLYSDSVSYDKEQKKWTNWSKDSRTKIYFNNYDPTDTTNTSIVYSFWRTAGIGSNGVNSKVNGKYSSSTYPLLNANGYQEATLSQQG